MNTLQERIQDEVNELPINLQKEVFDFILFIKNKINAESDNDFLSKNADTKQAIIEGLDHTITHNSIPRRINRPTDFNTERIMPDFFHTLP